MVLFHSALLDELKKDGYEILNASVLEGSNFPRERIIIE